MTGDGMERSRAQEHDDSIDFEASFWQMTAALAPFWHQQTSMPPWEAITLLVNQHAGAVEANAKLRAALSAYRSALRSGESESEQLWTMADEALNHPGGQ